jgi:hypothetical protein
MIRFFAFVREKKVNFIERRNKKNERTKPNTNWYIWIVEIGWKGKS